METKMFSEEKQYSTSWMVAVMAAFGYAVLAVIVLVNIAVAKTVLTGGNVVFQKPITFLPSPEEIEEDRKAEVAKEKEIVTRSKNR